MEQSIAADNRNEIRANKGKTTDGAAPKSMQQQRRRKNNWAAPPGPNQTNTRPGRSLPFPNGSHILRILELTAQELDILPDVILPTNRLKLILHLIAAALPFDDDFYREQYPDVDEAVKSGEVPSARTHFIQEGYLEGRLAVKPEVDERFYVDTYPDVAVAIQNQQIVSAYEHYIRYGHNEGRAANPSDQTLLNVVEQVLNAFRHRSTA